MADTKAEQEVLGMIAKQRLPFSAAILNGGHARRFGGIDKQEVEIEGVPIGFLLAYRLGKIAQELLIVGKPHKLYEDLGASQFEDDIKEGGPVCGLFSALVNASLEWVCLCAADMPFVSLALIRYLYVQSMSKEVDIVLCKTDDTLQPFFAFYKRNLVSELYSYIQSSSDLSFRHFIKMEKHLIIQENDIASICDPGIVFQNINDRKSLERARKVANRQVLGLDEFHIMEE
ncbi:MAG: molybdenum cofactor guanylyltransferase [Spirochaetia bacterium]|jgi:molybdopterin-guanine dinucleotide biosynthesis protein A|nr:molybdenum cofactor guanylyltransferase [Spirochaetia bacterium]